MTTIKEIILLAKKKDLNFQEIPDLTLNWCNLIQEGITEELHSANPRNYINNYDIQTAKGIPEYILDLGDIYSRGRECGLFHYDPTNFCFTGEFLNNTTVDELAGLYSYIADFDRTTEEWIATLADFYYTNGNLAYDNYLHIGAATSLVFDEVIWKFGGMRFDGNVNISFETIAGTSGGQPIDTEIAYSVDNENWTILENVSVVGSYNVSHNFNINDDVDFIYIRLKDVSGTGTRKFTNINFSYVFDKNKLNRGKAEKKYILEKDYSIANGRVALNNRCIEGEYITLTYFNRPTRLTAETDEIILPQPTSKMIELWIKYLSLMSAMDNDDTDYTVERFQEERDSILIEVKKMVSPTRKSTFCFPS